MAVQRDIQSAVEEVLGIEREADALVERARAEARDLLAEADQKAAQLRQQLVAEARQQADAMVAATREDAERDRERRLAEAERQIGELEVSAQQRLEAAARFAASLLLGEVPSPASTGPEASEQEEV